MLKNLRNWRISFFIVPAIMAGVLILNALNLKAESEPLVEIPGTIAKDLGSPALTPGAPGSSDSSSVVVVLQPRNYARYTAIVKDVQDPSSPYYGKFLSDADYESQFAPLASDVQSFKDYFTSKGLTPEYTSNDRLVLTVTGTTAQLDNAFGTQSQLRTNAVGESGLINVTSLKLPASLVSKLSGVAGFDRLHKRRTHHVIRPVDGLNPAAPTSSYNTPSSLRTAYNIASTGLTGAGTKVGITMWSAPIQSDLALWQNYYGPTLNLTIIGNQTPNSDAVESNLDVQMVHVVAPQASIRFYVAAGAYDAALITSTSQAINDNVHAITNSWGACEGALDSSNINAFHTVYMQAAAKGIAVFASSGDSGVLECVTSGGGLGYSSHPSADDLVTSVGGTLLTRESTNNAWVTETGWSCPVTNGTDDNSCLQANGGAGGGGIAIFFNRPAYQASITPPTEGKFDPVLPSGRRVQPDLSMDADPNSGCVFYWNGSQYLGGGTSASSPLMAGVAALAAQKKGGVTGGFNSFIYPNANGATWLFDVTSGYNGVNAHVGWDYMAGLGSLKNVNAFLKAFVSFPTITVLSSNVNPSNFGASVTFSALVSTAGKGTATGTVVFKDNGVALGAAVALNGSGIATFTTTTLGLGAHPITAEYNGDNTFNGSVSSQVSQQVNKAAANVSLTSTLNPSIFGASVTFQATVSAVNAPAGTPTGNIVFKDGNTTLNTVALNGSGQASYPIASLSAGSHTITATYSGDSVFQTGNIGQVFQTVKSVANTYVVTQPTDTGNTGTAGSLSRALSLAGQNDVITFDGVGVVRVSGTLPPLQSGVWIKGFCGQGGPLVTIDGSGTSPGTNGLTISSNSSMYGIRISGFPGKQVVTDNPSARTGFQSWCSVVREATPASIHEVAINVVAAPNPATTAQSVTITVTVSPIVAGATPTGTVTIKDGNTTIGTPNLNGSGVATLNTTFPISGAHSITVQYAGDGTYLAADSPPTILTVN